MNKNNLVNNLVNNLDLIALFNEKLKFISFMATLL